MPRTSRWVALAGAALLALATVTISTPRDAPAVEQAPRRGGVPGSAATETGIRLEPLVGPQRRPNVVVIMADDMRADELRFMPKTQRLVGAQGVRFENAFAPQPLCCPARASFLTGLFSHNHEVWSHQDPWGFQAFEDSSTLPVWLGETGYSSALLGKYLNGYGRQPTADGQPSGRYVPPGWTEWRAAVDGPMPERRLNGNTYHFFDTTLNVNGDFLPFAGKYQTRVLGRQSKRIIEEYAPAPRPFFFLASYVAPHSGAPAEADDPAPLFRPDGSRQKFSTTARPRDVWGKFDEQITAAPGAEGEADVSDKPFFIRQLAPLTDGDREGLLAMARQRAEALSVLDDQVELTIEALRDAGELDDTIVMVTSDNGYFLGEHRRRGSKILPYEPALRVPLLVRGPGIPAGEVRRDPFLMTDFAPTILDAAGASPRPVDGTSMLDVARTGDRGWLRPIITETGPRTVDPETVGSDSWLDEPEGPSPTRFSQGIRSPRYLYVEHASREQELYDLRTDPGQLTNLAGSERVTDVQRRLAEVLDTMRDCRGAGCRAPLPPPLRAE